MRPLTCEHLKNGITIFVEFGRVAGRPYVFEDTDPERLKRITLLHIQLTESSRR